MGWIAVALEETQASISTYPSIHPSIHPCVRSPIQPDVGFPDRDVARRDSLTDRPEKELGIMAARGRHECLSG